MLTNIDNLKADLHLLKKKYKLTLKEKDNYGRIDHYGGEMYCGTDQYLILDGEQYYVQTVEEIIKEVLEDSSGS